MLQSINTETINTETINEIKKKFNVLAIIDSMMYVDIKDLDAKIKKYNNKEFKNNDRILIFYQDTGYYLELNSGTSIFFNNLYEILRKYNVPSESVIIFTNHYGIKKEIDLLNKKMTYSINKIVETPLWYDFPKPETVDNIMSQSQISTNEFLYTCLNNVQRVHRNYTLCQLKKKNLLELGIVSYRFNK